MYCNCKDREIRFDIDIRGTGVATGSLVDLRGSNRIIEQFAVLAKGYGTNVINLVYRNGGMETAGTPLGSWTYAQAGTTAITRITANQYAGSAAAQWVMDASANVASLTQTVLTSGRTYTYSFYAMGTTGGEILEVYEGAGATKVAEHTLTTAYQLFTGTFTATGTSFKIANKAVAANNSKTIRLDNVIVIDNSPFSVVPTTLTSALEASMDGNYWTSVQAVTQANDGTVLFVTGKPCQIIRWNVSALTLNAGADTSTDFVRLSCLAT